MSGDLFAWITIIVISVSAVVFFVFESHHSSHLHDDVDEF